MEPYRDPMWRWTHGLALACFLASIPSTGTATAQTASIEVTVEGLRSDQGQLLVLVFQRDDGFPSKVDGAERQMKVPIDATTVTFRIDEIPAGPTAITVVHDEDGDDELDTNVIGIPKEGVGTSNNPRPRFGPPRYRDAVMELTEGQQTTSITVRYIG